MTEEQELIKPLLEEIERKDDRLYMQSNVREVLSAIPFKPLFGQQRGTTHWMTFVKFELTGNGG